MLRYIRLIKTEKIFESCPDSCSNKLELECLEELRKEYESKESYELCAVLRDRILKVQLIKCDCSAKIISIL